MATTVTQDQHQRQTDDIIATYADYVIHYEPDSDEAFDTARLCLADALGVALLALTFPACTKLLGPTVAGTIVPGGCRVPGTDYVLDPVVGAFNIGTMIRWLDYNDTFLAAEWGHPSDNIGGILAVADHLSRKEKGSMTMRDVLTAIIKAYEIQGTLALKNSFNKMGLDHVILVKAATAAVTTHMLGGSQQQVTDALTQAWVDAGPLRTYRHAPNTGTRKSWAGGDATGRGVFLALMTMKGEMGYPTVLSTPRWGFYDALFGGKPFTLERPLGSYVIENILFKVLYPAEFHAQTAVEAAIRLHEQLSDKLDDIKKITIATHESAIRIIDKKGVLHNSADRDHCLQYMVAVALLYGALKGEDYEEAVAQDPRIDFLRNKMVVVEDENFSRDYLDEEKRSIANSLLVEFDDGTAIGPVMIEYPIGHRRRRQTALPLLINKFEDNLCTRLQPERVRTILSLFDNPATLMEFPVSAFTDLFYTA